MHQHSKGTQSFLFPHQLLFIWSHDNCGLLIPSHSNDHTASGKEYVLVIETDFKHAIWKEAGWLLLFLILRWKLAQHTIFPRFMTQARASQHSRFFPIVWPEHEVIINKQKLHKIMETQNQPSIASEVQGIPDLHFTSYGAVLQEALKGSWPPPSVTCYAVGKPTV